MEPKLPAPNLQPERPPVSYEHNIERTQGPALEAAPERKAEQSGEQYVEATQQPPATSALPPPVVTAPSAPSAQDVPHGTSADTPLVAADEDLIEKEWVDRAKKIIEETKDDPYRREQEVGKLQADYLRKRYGKELGAS